LWKRVVERPHHTNCHLQKSYQPLLQKNLRRRHFSEAKLRGSGADNHQAAELNRLELGSARGNSDHHRKGRMFSPAFSALWIAMGRITASWA
jgi:hypothetical protein